MCGMRVKRLVSNNNSIDSHHDLVMMFKNVANMFLVFFPINFELNLWFKMFENAKLFGTKHKHEQFGEVFGGSVL